MAAAPGAERGGCPTPGAGAHGRRGSACRMAKALSLDTPEAGLPPAFDPGCCLEDPGAGPGGGFSAATKRRLAALTRSLAQDGDIARARVTRAKPGSRLIREWGGRTHSVAVSEDGFEWNGKTWRSLSAIAREITGAHWSGPRFFGVTGRSPARAGAPVTGHDDD